MELNGIFTFLNKLYKSNFELIYIYIYIGCIAFITKKNVAVSRIMNYMYCIWLKLTYLIQ